MTIDEQRLTPNGGFIMNAQQLAQLDAKLQRRIHIDHSMLVVDVDGKPKNAKLNFLKKHLQPEDEWT